MGATMGVPDKPDMHVNKSMAVGHYTPNVTYANEKPRPLTGEKNKEVVPDTKMSELNEESE